MEKKWNLQDIKPAQSKKSRTPVEKAPTRSTPKVAEKEERTGTIKVASNRSGKKAPWALILIVFFVISGIGFGISFLMEGADITVYPRNREPNVNDTFTAYKEPRAGELSYEIMSLEAESERQVTASGEENVSTQATGVINIMNNTDDSERLIKNTRFESANGLIFKIKESVVIPAAADGRPGEIQAEVFSDGTGSEYNVEPGKLTIPGFKEGGFDSLYENVYAENPVAFAGGFEGPKFIVDDQELENQTSELRNELKETLLDRVAEEKPAGFVFFDDAISITYQTLPAVSSGENLVTIKEKALLQIPIFKDSDFASYLTAATVPVYEGNPVRIENPETLEFTYTSASSTSMNLATLDALDFKLSGKPQVVWTFDETRLKSDIVGKSKTALPTVLGGYPAIERAEAVVRPFWKRTFPDSADKINIIEEVTPR